MIGFRLDERSDGLNMSHEFAFLEHEVVRRKHGDGGIAISRMNPVGRPQHGGRGASVLWLRQDPRPSAPDVKLLRHVSQVRRHGHDHGSFRGHEQGNPVQRLTEKRAMAIEQTASGDRHRAGAG